MQWIVYTYKTVGTTLECHAYGAFDNTADADAHKPFDEATAKELADNINSGSAQTGIRAMALPLEESVQPGV